MLNPISSLSLRLSVSTRFKLTDLERRLIVEVIYPLHRAHLERTNPGSHFPKEFEHLPTEYAQLLVEEAKRSVKFTVENKELYMELFQAEEVVES